MPSLTKTSYNDAIVITHFSLQVAFQAYFDRIADCRLVVYGAPSGIVDLIQKIVVCAVTRGLEMVLGLPDPLSFRYSYTRKFPQGTGVWA